MVRSVWFPAADGPETTADPGRHQTLVFFICGNPGLIQYYDTFFSTLRQLIDTGKHETPADIHLYGQDLAGFDDDDHEPFTEDNPPRDLEYQIQTLYERLLSMRIDSGPRKGAAYDDVLLIGHSIGAYMCLEIFHRHMQRRPESPPQPLNLRAGILLFPTVAHIAKSPSGQRLDLIQRTTFLDRYAHRLAEGLLSLCPTWALRWFIRGVLGFSAPSAAVTAQFLKSRDGVWQAIHLGKDEMRVVAEDRWPEELWEIADEAEARRRDVPKFFFYFGARDHWVADEYRDVFIERRNEHAAREGAPPHKRGRTRIVVDEGNLPHAFCLNHSDTVAEKVKVWIDEIMEKA